MVFLHFICKLLSNMRKQSIAAVSPEVFCLWLLTWKYYLIHPFLIDVIVIFSRVLRPIHKVRFRKELVQLILMGIIFSTTKVLSNISGLGGLALFKYPADLPGTFPRSFIDGHNVQFYCIKDKLHHRRHLYLYFFLGQTFFVSGHQTQNHDLEHLPRGCYRHSPPNNTSRFLYVFS